MKELYKYQDEKYKQFNQRLIKGEIIIGVRMPILRKLAKKIANNNYKEFISKDHKTHEEKLLHGLILGYIKVDNNTLLKYIDEFLPYNTNWAINDTTVSNLKAFKNIDIKYIDKYLDSKDPYIVRFGLVLLLNYYITRDNLNYIFDKVNTIKNDNYYVMMAKAWLISCCYIEYKDETILFLKDNKLDNITFNKAISKICDSYRVSNEDKVYLRSLRK